VPPGPLEAVSAVRTFLSGAATRQPGARGRVPQALEEIQRRGSTRGEGGGFLEGQIGGLSRDLTLLIIEHDMDLVFRVAQRITVLVQGSVLVEGPPEAIARDPEVRRVYLGERAPG